MPRVCIAVARIAFCLAALVAVATPVDAQDRNLVLMTRNLDDGTDFGPIFAATTGQALVTAVANAFVEVQASNVPERMAAIADEINAAQPDVVGLQEATLWRTGTSAPATTVAVDALQSLLDALAARGLHYAPIAVLVNTDAEAPSALGFDVRVTDRDVMLARTDLSNSDLNVLGVAVEHYETNLSFTSSVLGSLTLLRGWIAADIKLRGKSYRVITTHLESLTSAVRLAQASELIAGPANTQKAVVLAGDINSDADSADPLQNEAYVALVGAGFVDSWVLAHPNAPGFTWPLHGEDPFTSFATPSVRIDVVLSKGPVSPSGSALLGNALSDLTSSGLWPSDHAGLTASFVLEPY